MDRRITWMTITGLVLALLGVMTYVLNRDAAQPAQPAVYQPLRDVIQAHPGWRLLEGPAETTLSRPVGRAAPEVPQGDPLDATVYVDDVPVRLQHPAAPDAWLKGFVVAIKGEAELRTVVLVRHP